MISKEAFWENIKKGPERFTPDDEKMLRDMLSMPAFLKACAAIYKVSQELGIQMLGYDLTTPEGLREGLRAQGKARGMLQVIDALLDLAYGEEDDE